MTNTELILAIKLRSLNPDDPSLGSSDVDNFLERLLGPDKVKQAYEQAFDVLWNKRMDFLGAERGSWEDMRKLLEDEPGGHGILDTPKVT